MGPLGHEASEFLNDLGRRLSLISDEFQSLSSSTTQWHFEAHSSRKMMMLAANSRHCF